MLAEQRTRTVAHKEWTVPSPAHHTDVQSAYAVALSRQEQETGPVSDIEFRTEDDLLVLGYTTETSDESRGRVCEDIELDRDQWRRKAEFSKATLRRVRQLAINWSASPDGTLRQEASRELHETLDGPGDEPGQPGPVASPRNPDLPPDSVTHLPYEQRTAEIAARHREFRYSGETPQDRERDTAISHLLDVVQNQAERLSLARQALAKDGYFAYEIAENFAPQITELLIFLRRRAENAEAAIVRVRELAASWAEHRYIGLPSAEDDPALTARKAALREARDELIRALGEGGPDA
jgi:hypothetical protein